MASIGWARCADGVVDVLRRGAWYPIVEDSADGHVVVDVHGRPVRLPRTDLTVRPTPPECWSTVVRTAEVRLRVEGRGRERVRRYAVCPHCRERRDLPGNPLSLDCPRCGATSPVDWSLTC